MSKFPANTNGYYFEVIDNLVPLGKESTYIHLPERFILERAIKEGYSYDDMVNIIEKELKPKQI